MTKTVFLDLNGTLVAPVLVERLHELRVLPGVPAAIGRLSQAGFRCPVVTVQSRIAKGYFTEAGFTEWFRTFASELYRVGACIEGPYVCPHRHREPCSCKKPNTLLYERAADDLGVALRGSFLIGDTAEDMEAARRFGGVGCFVSPVVSDVRSVSLVPDAAFVGRDVPAAVDWILSRAAARSPDRSALEG
jgi:D-glycero-D-manno-heptose 1,7-bisphosphate phosphatase